MVVDKTVATPAVCTSFQVGQVWSSPWLPSIKFLGGWVVVTDPALNTMSHPSRAPHCHHPAQDGGTMVCRSVHCGGWGVWLGCSLSGEWSVGIAAGVVG